MAQIRSPICSVMGHVDHGKSSILDRIRGSSIVKGEAGGITQAIGASIIPLNTIKAVCKDCIAAADMKYTIPGLLFIDTPGHAAFTTLRKRGGNLADIAILVVDINEGFKPQTIEALEILKSYKTPFIIAANKVDLLPGWQTDTKKSLLSNINSQTPGTIQELETKMYEIVGKVAEFEMNSERFDRIKDYTKQIGIIPVSAATGQGIPELLMILAGLAQKFLEQCLECTIEGRAKGTVLEVKEEKGLGTTIDVILYDGTLRKNETIIIGGINEPIVTKVRALLEPNHLCEMMDKKAKYCHVDEVHSATGVKISAPNLEKVVAGMPLISAPQEKIEEVKALVQEQLDEVLIETDDEGIIIKADTLGSVEALIKLFKEKNVNIRKATVGNISKKDISDAESNYDKDPLTAVIIGFNVKQEQGVKSDYVKIFNSNIIYRLIEDFEKWQKEEIERQESRGLDTVVRPCKFQLLKGYCFRQSNPAIGGAEVLVGIMKTGMPILKNGKQISTVKGIQHEKESVKKLEKGKQAAVSMDHVTYGRQINEDDILYSFIPENDFKKLKEYKKHLSTEEKEVLKEIASMMRENNPVWGI